MNEQELLDKALFFLKEIGIEVKFGDLNDDSFLPGLSIEEGKIIIDKNKLQYPGDILHEAAHIAIVPAAERASLNASEIGNRKDNAAEEMMAIAWSYAACIQLEIDPYFVFHDKGYGGGGAYIANNFNTKNYFGLPMLQWIGLTVDEKNAATLKVSPYPAMIKWLRD
jgi:antirestriction protein ArdC